MLHILSLNWNVKQSILNLIPGLLNNLTNIPYQWHIRDNGSTDLDSSALVQLEKVSNLYQINHNRDSFSRGVNYLLEKANPADNDYVMLLNNDIEFPDNTSIKNMLKQMKPNVGVVGAKLLYNNTNTIQSIGTIFSNKYNKLPWHYKSGEEAGMNETKNRYFQAITAACCIVRADSLRKINGLNEDYRFSFEDVDFCLRIHYNLGQKIVYCADTKIYHEESKSLKKNPVNKLFLNHNVKTFRRYWENKYIIDHDFYLNDPSYNLVKE